MKSSSLLAAIALLIAAAATPGIAATNDPPLADAGLDQTVQRGSTVYLDGGGSRDPDGAITAHQWTITAPNGTTAPPNCPTCAQTSFRPAAVGTYEVTLTVTDDDGASTSDTLYVTVNPGEPPSVSLAGPNQLSAGDAGTYTADIAAGAATLSHVVWYVDGDRRRTSAVDGRAATTSRQFRFPNTGAHHVTVVAVDADGQRANATRTVTVTDPLVDDSPATDSDSSSSETDSGPVADVLGPKVVTGKDALTGTYELTDGVTGTWVLDGRDVGTGGATSLVLSPGVHELYASSDSGGVATFPDGTSTVVADPAPDLTLGGVTNGSVVTVDAYATDEFENLRSLTVLVDGEPVHSTTSSNVLGERKVPQLTLLQRISDIAPGMHTLSVRARDARGQVDVETRQIHVPGPPEVISAGYVNDEPLDTYHPRIEPDRYTGVYRVKVDLNGVEPEYIEVEYKDPGLKSIVNGYPHKVTQIEVMY